MGKLPLASIFATPSDRSDRFEWLELTAIAQDRQDLMEVRGLVIVARGLR